MTIKRTTLTLTGQAMIRGDTRADAPEAALEIASLVRGNVAFTNYEAAVYDPDKGETTRDGRFASPPSSVEALQSFGFNLLALANNHAFDLREQGILNTVDTARRIGVGHAGTGRDSAEAERIWYHESEGTTVAFISVASGLIHEGRATPAHPGVNELRVVGPDPVTEDVDRILESVRIAKDNSDVVIVSHHNHHYPEVHKPEDFKQFLLSQLPARLGPPQWLEKWAHALVDAGADVVAMHGPPFLHGMEMYKAKPIFYSLGNFIFQVPPESVHLEEPIMWESVVAHVDLSGDLVTDIRIQPIAMNKIGRGVPNPHDQFDVNEYHRTRGLPRRATGQQARFLLERFADFSRPYGTKIVLNPDFTATIAL